MKHAIAAFLFLVSWQQYELKGGCPESVQVIYTTNPPQFGNDCDKPYTVETVDHSINLATQKDVDLFAGKYGEKRGFIGEKAFNITVTEIKEVEPLEVYTDSPVVTNAQNQSIPIKPKIKATPEGGE